MLTPEDIARSQHLNNLIRRAIREHGGRLPFDRFMELALYAPGLGYYMVGHPFGPTGDFVTAPEISDCFAGCLAGQVAEMLTALGGGDVLELGGGTGSLARGLLLQLEQLSALPERYWMLDLSAARRAEQTQRLASLSPALRERVIWTDRLPDSFQGVLIANEVLDAMPVHRFAIEQGQVLEWLVQEGDGQLVGAPGPCRSPGLDSAVQALTASGMALADGYRSEINLRLKPWFAHLAAHFQRGAGLLIDYGHPAREYYHPQRHQGTVLGHFRHQTQPDPFINIGLQDLTAHVDFTAVARAARQAGFELTGFSTQAHFLLASGLDAQVAARWPADPDAQRALTQGIKQLTLPQCMGETFKVLGFSTGMQHIPSGFALRNRRTEL